MTIDPRAVGQELPAFERSWTSDDLLLYALGVGAGPSELHYTTENTAGVLQRAIPTFATVIGESFAREAIELAGSVDWSRAVDGAHALELPCPLPVSGRVSTVRRVTDVFDKGTAGIVVTEAVSADAATGQLMFVNRTSMFFPGQGGFGGERGPSGRRTMPATPPNHVVQYDTRPETPLLYRLTGDRYPIHSDPAYARAAGFPGPILHGLCTFGYAARALITTVGGGEVALLRAIEARFAAPAIPGDTLRTEIWCDGDEALFVTRRTDGEAVLDGGRAVFGDPNC